MDMHATATLKEIVATLNHLVPSKERPFVYMYDPPPPGMPQRFGDYRGHSVTIRDVRPMAKELSLDKEGFVLLRQSTRVRDFGDDAEVKSFSDDKMSVTFDQPRDRNELPAEVARLLTGLIRQGRLIRG